jgi:hypothetical protein
VTANGDTPRGTTTDVEMAPVVFCQGLAPGKTELSQAGCVTEQTKKATGPDASTMLSVDRTRLAYDRTML